MRVHNMAGMITAQILQNAANKGRQGRQFIGGGKSNGAEYIHSPLGTSGLYFKPGVMQQAVKAIQAKNNVISFANGSVYRYADSKGKNHILACQYDRLSQPYADLVAGRQDKETYNIAKFWNLLSHDGTYLGLYYSKDEQRSLLNSAGITEGFFTVATGERKQEYFYTNGSGIGEVAARKFEYDATYQMFRRGSALFDKYEVGSVFKIGGKEYVLDESRKFDIPYGDDVFDIQFPQLTT